MHYHRITENQVGRNLRHHLVQPYLAKAQCKDGPEPGPAQPLKCPMLTTSFPGEIIPMPVCSH